MLLTPNQRLNSEIASLGQTIAAHLAAAAHAANRQVAIVLALPTPELNEWLADGDAAQLFAAHFAIGTGINSAATAAKETLEASNIESAFAQVDVRSVADKLADQRRTIDFVDGVFVVSDIPPLEEQPTE